MRNQEIKKQFQKVIRDRRVECGQRMIELYKKNGEVYRKDFKVALAEALQKFQEHQKSDSNIRMKYIYVNCLRTSLATETYEYVIRIMDENEYADPYAVEVYYAPQYLKTFIDADKEYFSRLIMSKVIRAKKYEVKDFLREYLWDAYVKIIPTEIYDVLSQMDELEAYKNILKSETVTVGYGEMLERLYHCWKF